MSFRSDKKDTIFIMIYKGVEIVEGHGPLRPEESLHI